MEDDIVVRLRSNVVSQKYQLEAAAEIEALRRKLDARGDLPDRLRDLHNDLMAEDDMWDCYPLEMIGEAADEIERLRKIIDRMEASNG